jgi:hypothetical protein
LYSFSFILCMLFCAYIELVKWRATWKQ